MMPAAITDRRSDRYGASESSGAAALWLLGLGLASVCGCSSTGSRDGNSQAGASGGGNSAQGGGDSGFKYSACAPELRVGGFSLAVLPASGQAPPSGQLAGGVYDAPDPSKLWQQVESQGDCRLEIGPELACSPSCGAGQTCSGKACIPSPKLKSVGAVTVTGLGDALSVTPLPGRNDYYAPLSGPFPPFASGARLVLSAAGADYPGFSLEARGVTLLETANAELNLEAGKALTLEWTPEAADFGARVLITIDIAHHGGISAQITCDVADTGSAVVPAALLDALVARGVAGFPAIELTRRAVNSARAEPGCVEFGVSSGVKLDLKVAGVASCDCATEDTQCAACPNGQRCQANLTCK